MCNKRGKGLRSQDPIASHQFVSLEDFLHISFNDGEAERKILLIFLKEFSAEKKEKKVPHIPLMP